MFVTFSKHLKSIGGFRLGVGLRLTKNNWWYFLFALLFVGCFYFCLWSFVACGWALYYILYGIYKLYYLIFKYGALAVKKLYASLSEVIKKKRARE